MHPNNQDFARARLMLSEPLPVSGTFTFDADFWRDPTRVEHVFKNCAVRRGLRFTDEEVAAAVQGDGQELHDLGMFSLDRLMVRFQHQDGVWVEVTSWRGEAFAAFDAQVKRFLQS